MSRSYTHRQHADRQNDPYWGSRVLAPITRITYLLRMNQNRVSNKVKRKWLFEFKEALQETLSAVDQELHNMEFKDE